MQPTITETSKLFWLRKEIDPFKQRLISHPIYSQIKTLDHLTIFMSYHVFAVWDFMSLLKTLQRNLTCVDVPWVPKGNAKTRFLINEIVVGEESDVDPKGDYISHFELYINAMNQAGADTKPVLTMVEKLKAGHPLPIALSQSGVPQAAKDFVENTFDTIASNKPHIQAAVFTFGREDLIPGMFLTFVKELGSQRTDKVSIFQYYLERHIEVDGGHHSQLAFQMTEELCENNDQKWAEAAEAVKLALSARIQFWNAILETIRKKG